MSKYIKLEDATAILWGLSMPLCDYESAVKDIESLPTIDIVQCSECINNQRNTDETNYDWCLKYGYEVYDDDYCGYGEKQVASKLNNADDSLLTADSNGCKEQKSKLESVDTPTDTPTNTPTDLISRQAAIEALGEEPDIALDTEEEWAEHDAWARHVRAIESLPPVEDMGEVSDGYHTFNQLYHQRAVLFATIVNQNKDKAWKSWNHEDGKFCFDKEGEWFIVGVDTPEGSYTYHYEKKYWDMFECEELDRGKHWDGHTEDDVTRLLSLPPVESQPVCEDAISRQAAIEAIEERFFAGTVADINPSWRLLHEIIESLPPVEPKRPKGEWKFSSTFNDSVGSEFAKVKCSHCGYEAFALARFVKDGNFCPNCGADLRGDKE